MSRPDRPSPGRSPEFSTENHVATRFSVENSGQSDPRKRGGGSRPGQAGSWWPWGRPGAGRGHPRARAQRLEVLLGILGFFTFMTLVQTVTFELQGRNAIGSALLLLALCVATWFAYRARRRTGV